MHWLPKPARKRAFPRYAIVVHSIGFFVQCPIMLQNNEGLLKETTESAPTPQFIARADIVRHKSGISLLSRV